MTGKRLALVADDPRLVQSVQTCLREALGRTVFVCRTDAIQELLCPLREGPLLAALPSAAGPEALLRLVQALSLQRFPPPIVLLDGLQESFERVRDVLNPHVAHLLAWPTDAATLVRLVREQGGRSSDARGPHEESVTDVIARRLQSYTPSLLPMLECITLAALHDVTVLLTGETGTGKTFLARLMHDCSPRRSEPFLVVPCAAQPVNLLESLFFGHVKGAFTGADRNKEGKFQAAGKGTLLLDEIDTLPLEAQAGLLRVIETGEFEPVGSNETLHCRARLVVASNWDLEQATRQGRFRSDLYYRLNVMSFHLPPLRERVQDIPPLVRGMAAKFNTRFRKNLFDVTPEAMAVLESFDWPGNIRQLENVLQQAVLVSKGSELTAEDLPPFVRQGRPAPVNGHPATPETLESTRANMEKAAILRALQKHNWSRTLAAQALGISRVTLHKKIKKYKLTLPTRGSAAELNLGEPEEALPNQTPENGNPSVRPH
jgi:DNA-binding NtrC family response regulator